MRRYSDGLHSLYQLLTYYGGYGTTLIIPEGFIVSGIGNGVFVLYIIILSLDMIIMFSMGL